MIEFTVPGRPVPKRRPRSTTSGGKVLVYTPRETAAYEKAVGHVALNACQGRSITTDIAVGIKLYFKDRKFGDVDNYSKSILDGMQGIVFENDKQVSVLSVSRHRSENERAEVKVWEASDRRG